MLRLSRAVVNFLIEEESVIIVSFSSWQTRQMIPTMSVGVVPSRCRRAVGKIRLELSRSLEVYRSTLLIARITAHHTHPLPHPGLSGVPLFRSFGSRPPILDSRRHVLPNNSGVIYFFCCQSSCRFIPIRGLNPSLDKLSMRNP